MDGPPMRITGNVKLRVGSKRKLNEIKTAQFALMYANRDVLVYQRLQQCADDAVKIIRRQTIENIENINTEVGEYCRFVISGPSIVFIEKSWLMSWQENGPMFLDVCKTLQRLKSRNDKFPNTFIGTSKVSPSPAPSLSPPQKAQPDKLTSELHGKIKIKRLQRRSRREDISPPTSSNDRGRQTMIKIQSNHNQLLTTENLQINSSNDSTRQP